MKNYPLEIKKLLEFEGGTNEPVAWYSKGHHDKTAFYDALIQAVPGFQLRRGEDIRHETWRALPDKSIVTGKQIGRAHV